MGCTINCKCAKNSLTCTQACSCYESNDCLHATKMDNDDIESDSDDRLLSSVKLQFNTPLLITHITYRSKCEFELTVLYKCLEMRCVKKIRLVKNEHYHVKTGILPSTSIRYHNHNE